MCYISKIFIFPLLFIFVLYLKDFCSCLESFYSKKKKNPLKHRLDFHTIHFPSHPGSHLTLSLGIPWQSSHCQVPEFVWGTKTIISSVQSLRPHGLQYARLPCPSPTPRAYSNSSIEFVMPSNHRILCHPLLLSPSIFPSIRVFSNKSALRIRWSKYWSFSFSISPYNEYSGLISFRMDWLDLLAVQGALKSLLKIL